MTIFAPSQMGFLRRRRMDRCQASSHNSKVTGTLSSPPETYSEKYRQGGLLLVPLCESILDDQVSVHVREQGFTIAFTQIQSICPSCFEQVFKTSLNIQLL